MNSKKQVLEVEPRVGIEPTTDGLQSPDVTNLLAEMSGELSITLARELVDRLRRRLTRVTSETVTATPDRLVREFLQLHETKFMLSRKLRPASKQYRRDTIKIINRTWPTLATTPVAQVRQMDCLVWAAGLKYSASRFNATIATLKRVFAEAVSAGVIAKNPAESIERIPEIIRKPQLPTREQLQKVIAYLESSPESRRAVNMVKFMLYSGLRIGEVRKLKREDITEHGIRVGESKNGEDGFVPILPELRDVIEKLPPTGLLFKIHNPRTAVRNACIAAGIKPLTNHLLRHLFATRCIECGVDIPTVSEWLRHKDGGALALKRYNHVRDDHSKEMAAKVKF
jgi:integrase